jgi:hypothetical protein
MQSANLKEIKAALWGQAFGMGTQVGCAIGRVVAIRKQKGQLQAMVRGWGVRWYAVESVTIEDWLAYRNPINRVCWDRTASQTADTINRSPDEEIHGAAVEIGNAKEPVR